MVAHAENPHSIHTIFSPSRCYCDYHLGLVLQPCPCALCSASTKLQNLHTIQTIVFSFDNRFSILHWHSGCPSLLVSCTLLFLTHVPHTRIRCGIGIVKHCVAGLYFGLYDSAKETLKWESILGKWFLACCTSAVSGTHLLTTLNYKPWCD